MCNTSDKQFLKISKIYIVIWYHIIIFYNILINLILPISHMNKYKNTKPKLILEEYFSGKIEAWGQFEDRFGINCDHFRINLGSFWDNSGLILRSIWDHFGIILG